MLLSLVEFPEVRPLLLVHDSEDSGNRLSGGVAVECASSNDEELGARVLVSKYNHVPF